jgi:hypothetical protein
MPENTPSNMPGVPTRPMTYGEKAVGLTFNPSNDPQVQEVKELYAKIMGTIYIVTLANRVHPTGLEPAHTRGTPIYKIGAATVTPRVQK